MFWCVSFCLGAFVTVSLMNENAHNPHHWTLNSCFCAFLSVWVHLELFRYCTKLAAKLAKLVQLMQMFRPQCLVKFFCNESSRSKLLDPKIMFWCVSFRSSAFWTVSLLYETGCKTSQTGAINAKFHATISRLIFSQRTLPIHTIGP